MRKKLALLLVLCMVLVLTIGCVTSFAATKYLSLGTGGVAGAYYPIGGAIANLITKNIPGYTCTAESTGGAVENVMLIHRGKIDLGFVDAADAYYAQNKLDPFKDEDIKNLRGVVSIYPETVQVVTLDEKINTIADLKGKRVAVGSPGSGNEIMAKELLKLYEMTYDDIKEDFIGYVDASAGLKDQTIDVAVVWSGVPTSAIMELGTQHKIKILDFSDDIIAKLRESLPFCVPMRITKSHYPSLISEANTIAVPATLQCSAKLSEEFVYDLLTVLFNNLDVIARAHARGGDLSLETALNGMEKIELHPGAVKFYKEKGLLK